MSEKPDWNPVLNGEEYCSPACGHGCTQAEFELATMRGERLAARMNEMPGGFKDWSVRVWENMGWHYEAIRVMGEGKASPDTWCSMAEYLDDDFEPRRYWCDSRIAGHQFHANGDTPEEALNAVMAELIAMRDAVVLSFNHFRANQ